MRIQCFLTNPKNLPSIFLYHMKGQSFQSNVIFSYSCATADKLSTDLRARAVSVRQLSYLLVNYCPSPAKFCQHLCSLHRLVFLKFPPFRGQVFPSRDGGELSGALPLPVPMGAHGNCQHVQKISLSLDVFQIWERTDIEQVAQLQQRDRATFAQLRIANR